MADSISKFITEDQDPAQVARVEHPLTVRLANCTG